MGLGVNMSIVLTGAYQHVEKVMTLLFKLIKYSRATFFFNYHNRRAVPMRSTQRGRLGQGLCRPYLDPTRERRRCRDHSLRHRDEGEEHGTVGRGKVHDCQGSSGTRRSHQGKTGDLFLSKF